MPPDSKGRDLFIVDNSTSGWTGLRYLEEWCGIAKAFDIATGFFEIRPQLPLLPKTSLPIDIEGIPASPPQNWTVVSAE